MQHLATTVACSAMVILLMGCTTTEEQVTQILDDSSGPLSSNYKDMTQYPGNVTCGKYLSRDYQGFPVYKDFVVIDTVANLNPTRMDVTIYCSNEPAAALDIEFAIDYESQKLQIDRILEDFRLLAVPLAAYMRDNQHSHGPNKVFRRSSSRDNRKPAYKLPRRRLYRFNTQRPLGKRL